MDQTKIGSFLRELRKEKNLTQEQLAERFNVARRTVSRWETGSNLPDIDILIEMSDYFDVDLREILDGERKKEMENEMKETVLKVAEYDNEKAKKLTRIALVYMVIGIVAFAVNLTMEFLELPSTALVGFVKGASMGLELGAMILGVLVLTGMFAKMQAFKMRLLRRE